MLIRLSVLAALTLLAAQVMTGTRAVAAEGEATDLAVESQTCTAGFKVQVVLTWTPSGAGQQWVDFSLQNDGFSTPYVHGGPFSASQAQATMNNLEPQRNYYVRVSTFDGSEWQRSDLFAFTTGCQAYEATGPLHLAAASISDTAARFSWEAGNGNLWYCLDYAVTSEDLLNKTGTWRNSGCGLTATTLVVEDMHCGRTYSARVWAWTTQGGRYSASLKVTTQPCASTITEATNLRALFLGPEITRLAWTPGSNNIWYCLDLARSQQDLLSFGTTWENRCGFTEPEIELRRLDCETVYYYRVYTWNFNVNAHSVVRNFTTAGCDLDDERAPALEVEVHKSLGEIYRAEVLVRLPDGCRSPGYYRIKRDGNKIEITVENLVAEAQIACSNVTQTHLWTIRLGDDFEAGVTYQVEVNGQLSDFFTPS
ncbi:MAG TPA: hypothetical protein VFS30_02330 [Dehalococcoidia bacterium]|nr:hypothetical protein [Dehalococcoidia bacterium]